MHAPWVYQAALDYLHPAGTRPKQHWTIGEVQRHLVAFAEECLQRHDPPPLPPDEERRCMRAVLDGSPLDVLPAYLHSTGLRAEGYVMSIGDVVAFLIAERSKLPSTNSLERAPFDRVDPAHTGACKVLDGLISALVAREVKP